MPLISIVITCYNHAHFLPEAIESALAQQYGNFEIIVVDDGSTDNTRETAAKYAPVRYVYQPNGGLSSARNTGIMESKGSLLVFLDADDWLMPRCPAKGAEMV
jgi:glycosyltransferase involved in cell wall biosynthesis